MCLSLKVLDEGIKEMARRVLKSEDGTIMSDHATLIRGRIMNSAKELLAKERPDYKQNRRRIHAEIEEEGRALLEQMGLKDKMGHYPHQLSGGQCQRVAIARALCLKPDILCFDEPTSALDPELTGEVLRVIRELADKNMTMIIVTHEMNFARDVASKVIFIDDGRICEMGTPDEVFGSPKRERTKQFLASYVK